MFNRKFDKNTFSKLHVLVIGDAMIDAYCYGNINRQSPEANAPIVDINSKETRLGGAANVALNVKALEANTHLMCFKGNDESAIQLQNILEQENINTLFIPSERKTSVKTRVYNKNAYVLRLDEEDTKNMNNRELEEMKIILSNFLNKQKIDIVILQDYNKGFFTTESIEIICNILLEKNIPFAVDPKKDNFFTYKNASLFKPNLKEINWAMQSSVLANETKKVENACIKLIEKTQSKNVLLTLAENGAIATNGTTFYYEKAHKRSVVDVSGAGDTVIAMASLLLALKTPLNEILYYSNLAGGLVIEERGVQALRIKQLVNKKI